MAREGEGKGDRKVFAGPMFTFAIFGHVARLPGNIPHTRPCYAKSSYRSVDPRPYMETSAIQPLKAASVLNKISSVQFHQVDHVPNGPTNSAAITTMFPLRLCGGTLLAAVTRQRRYGPSRNTR